MRVDYPGTITETEETINRLGQTTSYNTGSSTLILEYNEHNQVAKEIENETLSVSHSYSEQGVVDSIVASDGSQISFDYYPNGSLQSKVSDGIEIYYNQLGQVERTVIDDIEMLHNNLVPVNSSSVSPLSISVEYNINSQVAVNNFIDYYGLVQDSFNCYAYSIGVTDLWIDPGYYSDRNLNMQSLSTIKLNVEEDQESIGLRIYDSTVSGSIPNGHCWKIALRICVGDDYHFMKKNYGSTGIWSFKAGIGGPVMQLRGSYTPSSASWDSYSKNFWSGEYEVHTSGSYDSSIHYMIIED